METVPIRNKFKLRFLCLISRHGDRAPGLFLHDDHQSNHYWPDGAGSLTKKGKIQSFHLGKILRTRYDEFLGDKYIPQNVNVRSTNYTRNVMSAQCSLAGMFPPTEEEMLVPGLRWQPIFINPEDEFNIKIPEILQKPPGRMGEDQAYMKHYDIFKKNKNILSIVNTLSKCKFDKFGFKLLALDAIIIMHQNNLTIPNEVSHIVEDVSKFYTSAVILFSICNTEAAQPTSHVFKEILENIESLIATEESSTKTKTFFYSLQDVHIIAIIYALTRKAITCPIASCLMLEFYQDTENLSEFYFQILFLNDHNKEPLKLTVQEQKAETCSFVNFKHAVEDYININLVN